MRARNLSRSYPNIKRSDAGFATRNLALRLILEIEENQSYANLVVPASLRDSAFEDRDRNFVTELVYGTLRMQLLYDAIIESAAKRPVRKIDSIPLNILRLTAHQLLSLQISAHAPVDSAVRLTVRNKAGSASGFVNAASRRISEKSIEQWISELTVGVSDLESLAIRFAHPLWIVEEYFLRLGNLELVKSELEANNRNPRVSAVIYPGKVWSQESLAESEMSQWVPEARLLHGNPEALIEIKAGAAGIQDQGSYLVAQALLGAFAGCKSTPGVWVDMCAGPGGKAALLDRWAREQGRTFLGLEISEHRAALMRRVTDAIVVSDGRKPPLALECAALVLLDAPCSGLGALRRRPDARLRKKSNDIPGLVALQRNLLQSAISLLAPGAILGYVTCSPLARETIDNRDWVLTNFPEMVSIKAKEFFPKEMDLPDSSDVQLWPGAHGTDAMYLALFQKKLN
jgi:16S rRNA (cytosine967-C5)-methyltransferase